MKDINPQIEVVEEPSIIIDEGNNIEECQSQTTKTYVVIQRKINKILKTTRKK